MKKYFSRVEVDPITRELVVPFDYAFTGKRVFEGWSKPEVPKSYRLGLIVGPSGSGKSLLLSEFGKEVFPKWEKGKSVASHFKDDISATKRLMGVGLNSIPVWCSDYHILSTGEKFRADLARRLDSGVLIDEFTSVVDRTVAKAACCSLRRYVDAENIENMILASCHEDIIPWLRPDWYFDTRDGILHDGRLLRRPPIVLRMYKCDRGLWKMFKDHHYLSANLSKSCYSYVATASFSGEQESVVGFASMLPLPCGSLKNAWREHRTVVLPDYQGLGIGPRISDALAQMVLDSGREYYSRTAHPRFGAYRNRPDSGWIRTAEDLAKRKIGRIYATGDMRQCFSHQFIGNWNVKKRPKMSLEV